ncbi:MAG: phytoene desaturase [Bacteroidetes bacterium]|nr:phytoene desaturase [Bacteroidota bacterium]
MNKKVIIIGSGLGGLSTALRLSKHGYDITILEKHSTPGGRLNIINQDGFRFDMGPSFMSMTFEFDELFESAGVKNPLRMEELDPIYQVYFEGKQAPYKIFKDIKLLAKEFEAIEPDFENKIEKYLKRAGEFFNDTENIVVKSNFDNKLQYFLELSKVPKKHLPYLFRTMWSEVDKAFTSEEVKIIFSLVAFFLGATPFKTPSIYSLLNYTELKHNGYWRVKGGMYNIVEEIIKILMDRGVKIYTDTEIVKINNYNGKLNEIEDQNGKKWKADIIVSNSDAASFRGKILNRKNYDTGNLDKMNWTLAPFTIYLGVEGKINGLDHHNYFLGKDFKKYADEIFTLTVSPENPYYYVNVSSKYDSEAAPAGCENIFILCPVPDLRYKSNWDDKEKLASSIIRDISTRTGFDIEKNIITKKILTPKDWEGKLNLYRGSGLGLAHNLTQVGAFRPNNKDENFKNLYYVGASTTPGTGLPMVVISSKLVTERIIKDDGII